MELHQSTHIDRVLNFISDIEKGKQSEPLTKTDDPLLNKIIEKLNQLAKYFSEKPRFLERTGELAKVGGWQLDVKTGKVMMTPQTLALHGIGEDYTPPQYSTGSEWYPPEAWPTVKSAVETAISDGKPYDLESPFITANNKRIWVRIQGFPVTENGKVTRVEGTFQDITERKQNEIELKKKNEELTIFKAVLDNSTDFIGIANNEMIPTYCNPAGRKMIGIPPEQNVSEVNIPECYPEYLREKVLNEILHSMATKGSWQGETFFQNLATKELIPVHDVHFLVKDPATGSPLGHATITRDITKERSLLMQAMQQTKLASLGEMSAGIAHEINNPLTVIIGVAQLLPEIKGNEQKFKLKTESILKAAFRIEKIVKGLKKFSRTSEMLARANYDVRKILDESITLVESRLKLTQTEIDLNIKPNLIIFCDQVEIEQVFIT